MPIAEPTRFIARLLLGSLCGLGLVAARPVAAQAQTRALSADARAEAGAPVLVVERAPAVDAACWDATALWARVLHYLADGGGAEAVPDDVRITLSIENGTNVDMRIVQGAGPTLLRQFTHLPRACAERRDSVAVSIALALEHLPHVPSASPVADAARETPVPAGAQRMPEVVAAQVAEDSATAPAPRPAPKGGATMAPAPEAREDATGKSEARATRGSARSADVVSEETAHPPVGPFRVTLGVQGLHGALPSLAFLGTAGLALQLPRQLSVELSGFASALTRHAFEGGVVRTRLLGGQLLGCHAWPVRGLVGEGCVGAAAGLCRARGRGYAVAMPDEELAWAAALARVALRWPAQSRVSLRFSAQAHINVVRPSVGVSGSRDQLAPPWAGGGLGLDVLFAIR